jgi:hypothetical protein
LALSIFILHPFPFLSFGHERTAAIHRSSSLFDSGGAHSLLPNNTFHLRNRPRPAGMMEFNQPAASRLPNSAVAGMWMLQPTGSSSSRLFAAASDDALRPHPPGFHPMTPPPFPTGFLFIPPSWVVYAIATHIPFFSQI